MYDPTYAKLGSLYKFSAVFTEEDCPFPLVTNLVRYESEASRAILPITCERARRGKENALIISFKSLDPILAEAYVPVDFLDM